MTGDVVGVGILGTGRIAGDFARGLAHANGAELRAVGSRSQDTADKFAAEFGCAGAYDSYEAVAADPNVELVYVATPHSLHCENSLMSLDAGKHVICEKPFTINATEAEKVVDRARDKERFLMEAMWTRYVPAVVHLRELLAKNSLGDVQLMVSGGGYIPKRDPDAYLFRPDLGGGVLLDAGMYMVSMASMIFGQPSRIQASCEFGPTRVDEHDVVVLGHRSGALADLHVSLRVRKSPDVLLLGDRGNLKLHAPIYCPRGMTIELHGEPGQEKDFDFPGNGYQFEAEEAARCIREGKTESAIMPLDETLAIMRTLDEIRDQFGLRYPMEG